VLISSFFPHEPDFLSGDETAPRLVLVWSNVFDFAGLQKMIVANASGEPSNSSTEKK